MGLDACVYCNCYEAGSITAPPPQPELVYIDPETGELLLRWEEPGADEPLFYNWRKSACKHGEFGWLVIYHLGNISLIGFLRTLFGQTPERFPILLSKVVYSGVHGGDTLSLDEVEILAVEIPALQDLHCADAFKEDLLRNFEKRILHLIEAARSVRKPIVF